MDRFPGVYEAKCVGRESGTEVRVVIPQVYGPDAVPARYIGDTPEYGVHGFVSFISGQIEYPVWLGAAGREG